MIELNQKEIDFILACMELGARDTPMAKDLPEITAKFLRTVRDAEVPGRELKVAAMAVAEREEIPVVVMDGAHHRRYLRVGQAVLCHHEKHRYIVARPVAGILARIDLRKEE